MLYYLHFSCQEVVYVDSAWLTITMVWSMLGRSTRKKHLFGRPISIPWVKKYKKPSKVMERKMTGLPSKKRTLPGTYSREPTAATGLSKSHKRQGSPGGSPGERSSPAKKDHPEGCDPWNGKTGKETTSTGWVEKVIFLLQCFIVPVCPAGFDSISLLCPC